MDKVWLVTGSASGLGRNIAEAVLESGDRLVATARDPRRLDDLVNKFGERVRAVSLDVADESAAQAAVQVALDAFGRLDVVVNNAGFGDIAPFEQLSAERFKAVMDTNFYGVVNVTRAAVRLMREQRSGCILQISSVGGRLTRPGSTPYHAAKWAVGGFTESLAQELSPFGPALIPYSQDSDNIEFTNLIAYSSSAERLRFENADYASDVPRPLRRASVP